MLLSWTRANYGEKPSKYFNLYEFDCHCHRCGTQIIDTELLARLDALREVLKSPIIIRSGFRCVDHNKAVGGKIDSRHLRGLAADISSNTVTMEELSKVCEQFFKRIGVAKTFVHVDIDVGEAKWTY